MLNRPNLNLIGFAINMNTGHQSVGIAIEIGRRFFGRAMGLVGKANA